MSKDVKALHADFDKDLRLGGVLFNKVGGEAHSLWLREALEAAGMSTPVLGGIPKVSLAHLVPVHVFTASINAGRVAQRSICR